MEIGAPVYVAKTALFMATLILGDALVVRYCVCQSFSATYLVRITVPIDIPRVDCVELQHHGCSLSNMHDYRPDQ